MERFRFILVSIIIILAIVAFGYWAFMTLEPGGSYASRQKQRELEKQNQALVEEVEDLKSELAVLQSEKEVLKESVALEQAPKEEKPATATAAASGKHQSLINELQKLVNDKVYMKEKSRGTRVGTVQNFLNIYFGTNKKVDNDYGKTTKADVAKFQKAVGLTADGEAGPATFQKMIDWLKKQS